MCKSFHTSAMEYSDKFMEELGRHNYVTPTSYLELISSFKTLLNQKQTEVLKNKGRYEVGLEKLAFAASQVYPKFEITSIFIKVCMCQTCR